MSVVESPFLSKYLSEIFFELSNTLDLESRQLLEQSYNASFAAYELHEKPNQTADSLNGEVVSNSEDDLAAVILTIAFQKVIAKKRKNLAQRFR